MKLSTFVEETIYEIGMGIQGAKVKLKNIIAVAPGMMNGKDIIEKSYIDFNLEVVVKESTKQLKSGSRSISGKIEIARIVGIGGDASSKSNDEAGSEAEHTQRIAFKVPVWFNANFRGDDNVDVDRKFLDQALKDNDAS